MNEGVYRGVRVDFHRYARQIRFAPPEHVGALQGIAGDVKRGFEDWEIKTQALADTVCEGVNWERALKGMDEAARAIVMKRAHGEIARRCDAGM